MNIIIAGCGRVGAELAKALSGEEHNVVVIDLNPQAFDRLGNSFNGVTLAANAISMQVLKNAGIEKAEVFCALTNNDNANIMISQMASKIFNVKKVIARVYDPQKAEIYHSLGLDTVSGTVFFAAMVKDKIMQEGFFSYLTPNRKLGMLEIPITAELSEKKVDSLNIPGEMLIAALIDAQGEIIIPTEQTLLKEGTRALAISKTTSLAAMRKKMRPLNGSF